MTAYILAALIAFAAFFVRGFSGFGSALVMTPLLALVFEPRLAVVSTAILGVAIGAGIAVEARHLVDRAALRRLMIAAVPCLVAGSALLAIAEQHTLRRALGLLVVFFGARMLRLAHARGQPTRPKWPARAGYLAGALGGFLGGTFGTGGPPVVVFLENQIDSRRALRATVLAVLLFFDATRLGSYAIAGVIDTELLVAALAMLPAALLGAVTGARMHLRVSEGAFRAVMGAFLLASGLLLLR